MAKYRKRPVVIEAEQWFKVTYDEIIKHVYEDDLDVKSAEESIPIYHLGVGYYNHPDYEVDAEKKCQICGRPINAHGWMDTFYGKAIVCPGNWIIPDGKGNHFPIKDSIFKETYEAVED